MVTSKVLRQKNYGCGENREIQSQTRSRRYNRKQPTLDIIITENQIHAMVNLLINCLSSLPFVAVFSSGESTTMVKSKYAATWGCA